MKHIAKLILGLIAAGTPVSVYSQSALYGNEFPLSDVKLLESPFKSAMDLNVNTLLSYDTDRLLAPYFKEAGLDPKGADFPNWAGLDGHVGGHYISALAIHYAATGDERLKERLDYVLSQLALCAAARNDGYIGGVPNGDVLWEEIRKGNGGKVWDYWVPWYNVHKMYAGLRDAWVYTGSKPALNLFLNLCDWGADLVSNLSDEQMEAMLGNEFGGMNEVYADAYAITGQEKYLDTARRFTHHALYDDLNRGVDNLDNLHANTQVPKVIGYQRVAEVSGDPEYLKTADFFWNTVVNNRSLSFGGNSRREHFASAADAKSYVDEREGPESCNTNNMLKLTEGLFRMKPDARYADFYERALYNHILSTQHPEHGGYVYFTPARPGHYRVYSQPNSAMWCCVGTGMENHGKYGQFIYTHAADSLWVNLFIPSELDWKQEGVRIVQENEFPVKESTNLTVRTDAPKTFTVSLRHPGWCDTPVVKVNGKPVKEKSNPSGYIPLTREWNDGDVIEMSLPMKMTIEELNYLPEYVSVMRGPILLGARFNSDVPMPGLVAGDHRWGHIAGGPLVSVFYTPLLIGDRKNLVKKLNSLKPAEEGKMSYIAKGIFENGTDEVVLEPFSGIHDSRYTIYFLSMTPKEYSAYQQNAKKEEGERLALDARTVDAVNTGEQQPEADHQMNSRNTRVGNFNGQPWREASNGGFFAYDMNTGDNTDLLLRVRYWGNETGSNGKLVIFIDDVELAKIDNSDRWTRNEFVDEEYVVPAEILKGKKTVNVKFQSGKGESTGGVYYVRLLQP
ncbi:MAG: glycoside hydrolase family 127 protein [Muribaculaceae bacterium]|nr:glycoside hydrolase family 127 protein [Muribaculaceae bacterium]